MCGISGFIWDKAPLVPTEQVATKIEQSLYHRGPDSGACWVDHDSRAALIHRRLAVVDLSPSGNQPMQSACGRFVICYNGEVYNREALIKNLDTNHTPFRGHSDTEAILESCAAIGVKATTEKLIGMFAFALWDIQDRRLWLVRDRLGIKPLYWTLTPQRTLIFGSELKALRVHDQCPNSVDLAATSGFMRHNYIAGTRTIYENVQKLAPGCILSFSPDMETPKIEPFWNLKDTFTLNHSTKAIKSDDDAIAKLENLLHDAVDRRMIADVPLGAFLSGGIDSSLIAALMQTRRDEPVKTFSIGFETAQHNEAQYAAEVAKHLGTDHTELYVTGQDALDVIPKLPDMFDEPFADSSQIPTYLLSSLTRKFVTVALSGDGGDELFGGYERYFTAQRINSQLGKIPSPVRKLLARTITSFSPDCWDAISHLLPKNCRPTNTGDRAHKLAAMLRGTPDDVFRSLVSHWENPDDVVIGGKEPKGALWDETLVSKIPDFLARMQYMDSATYLTDDILTKVDRTSMFDGLEARVPFLDHRVAEFAATLPNHMKVRNGQGKWILRQILEKYVPRHLFDRPKMGFGVPLDSWLRGPLRDWAEDLLSEETFKRNGLLRREPVMKKWQQHVSADANWQYHIWDVLMLHAWANRHL